jgi:hypothetical protein
MRRDIDEALRLIEQNGDLADFEGPKPERLIAAAEARIGQPFPPSYRDFLKAYGAGDIAGEEFYGLIHERFEHSGIPDAIWLTLSERESSSLPEELVIVYSTGDGCYYAIDGRLRDSQGEAPIVAWRPGISQAAEKLEIVADHYGAFLKRQIEEAINLQ